MNPLFEIKPTSYGGRGAFAFTDISAGTVVHISPAPFAHVVYRVFRKEVCACCWRYAWDDAGKGSWPVKMCEGVGKGKERDRARGGLWFCSDECKAWWEDGDKDGLAMEVYEIVDREAAKSMKIKVGTPESGSGKGKRDVLDVYEIVPADLKADDITEGFVDGVWAKAEDIVRTYFSSSGTTDTSRRKGKRRAPTVPLEEEHDIDLARFIASGLISIHRSTNHSSQGLPSITSVLPESSTPPFDPSDSVSSSWSTFLSLQPNALPALQSLPRQLSQWVRTYLFLAFALSSSPTHPLRALALDPTYIRNLFARDIGNAFGIWQLPYMDESEMFGWGVWIDASFFNHSCAPNLVKQRTARTFAFTTTRPVRAGEELCISYGNVNEDARTRRKRLWEGWWFWCRCARCVEELGEGQIGAVRGEGG